MELSDPKRLTLADLPYCLSNPIAQNFVLQGRVSLAITCAAGIVVLFGLFLAIDDLGWISIDWHGHYWRWNRFFRHPSLIAMLGSCLASMGFLMLLPVTREIHAFVEQQFQLIDDNGIPLTDAKIRWKVEPGGKIVLTAASPSGQPMGQSNVSEPAG